MGTEDARQSRAPVSFVVVTVEDGRQYVQFATDDQGLYLDLPELPLTVEEHPRAGAFFAPLGVVPTSIAATGGGSPPMRVFNPMLGQDANRGAELALRVIEEVYGLPPGTSLRLVAFRSC